MSPSTDPVLIVAGLLLLTLAPFAVMLTTSYLKLAVVLSLVRNAIGVQQVPSNIVLNGLAVIFSVFIMTPVALDTWDLLEKHPLPEHVTIVSAADTAAQIKGPMQQFLTKHAHQQTVRFFLDTARRLWPERAVRALDKDSFAILVPAFTVSELTRAFQIGFLLYLPFVTVDIIASNILLAMGMMMVSPSVISLPFKLLLFVLMDGWALVVQGLVLSYR